MTSSSSSSSFPIAVPEGYTPCGAEVPRFLRDCRAMSVQRNEIRYVQAQNSELRKRGVDRLYQPASQLMRVSSDMAHELCNARNMLAALTRVVDRQAHELDAMHRPPRTMPVGNPRVTPVRLPGPPPMAPGAPWQKRVARRSKRGGVRHRIDLDQPAPESNDRKRRSDTEDDDDDDDEETAKRVASSAEDVSPNSDELWPESESD